MTRRRDANQRRRSLLQQAINQDVDVDLLRIGNLVPAATAAALRVGRIVKPVLGIEHTQPRRIEYLPAAAVCRACLAIG